MVQRVSAQNIAYIPSQLRLNGIRDKAILNNGKKLNCNRGKLDRKVVKKGRGFLVHISRTYSVIVSYLKGICHVLGG